MSMSKAITIIVLCAFTSLSCAYIQIATSQDFNRYSTSGALRPGLTEIEAREILGSPKHVASRKTVEDTRSVWTYKQPYLRSPSAYFILGLLTLGILWLFPAVDEESHYVVFSDGIVIGWDLPDPYAPDLIIEKRER